MRIKFTIALLSILSGLPLLVLAQPRYQILDFNDPKLKSLTVHAQTGYANYFGDLCPTGDCYTKANFNFGIGVNRHINDYLFLTFNAQYYRISGSDLESGNTSRLKRNLSFRADNFEFSLLGNFEFLNYNSFRFLSRSEFPISMFLFTGIGITTNSPKAEYNGDFISLRPLKTEGVSYSPISAVVPIGLGIGYKIMNNLSASLVAGYRFTFTDYLDDVSGTYIDPVKLSSDEARELAFRGDEVGFPGYGEGARRGNSGSNDGYLLVDLKIEYSLPVNPVLGILGKKQKTIKGRSSISAPSRQVQKKK